MTDVCIAICTCDRHSMLRDLLTALAKPRYRHVPIIIVDNGTMPAQEVVDAFRPALDIRYERLTEAGLCPVRNRSLEIARSLGVRYLASIDDDEYPADGWLDELLKAAAAGAEVVYGCVYPVYDQPPPFWAQRWEPFHREGQQSTANALIDLSCLPADPGDWFQPRFNAAGGEDAELLIRLEEAGARRAVAMDAVVYEQIPASRLTLRYILRRGLRDGAFLSYLMLRRKPAGMSGNSPAAGIRPATALVGSKLGYALNHVFWAALGERWRIYCAASDFGTAAGLLGAALGVKFHFYGRRDRKSSPKRPATPAAIPPEPAN